jgi:hypothetical protein
MTSFRICCVVAVRLFKNGGKSRSVELMVSFPTGMLPGNHVLN